MRERNDRVIDRPGLPAGDLQNKHFVNIVVQGEAGCIAERKIDIGVRKMIELCLQCVTKGSKRLSGSVYRRKCDYRALVLLSNPLHVRHAKKMLIP